MLDVPFLERLPISTEIFTLDVIVIAVIAVLLFVHTLRYGKEHVVSFILTLYVALLAFIYFPYKDQFLLFTETELQQLGSNALVFAAFVIFGYLAISPLLRNRYISSRRSAWVESTALSAAAVALLIAFSYHVLPLASIYTFDTSIEILFAPSQFFFWWLVAPLAVLFIAGRH